jgi:hypothetical protein
MTSSVTMRGALADGADREPISRLIVTIYGL